MSSRLEIELEVNGRKITQAVEARKTLAEFLRLDLGLTGTKVSCELQVCGVCTVLVDNLPVSSCTYLVADADGHTVQTIEGLADDGQLHPLQEAFINEFALQCGYCTPGFIMMAIALLADNPRPSREDIVHYLDGNICRCTGYRPIIDAVLAASAPNED